MPALLLISRLCYVREGMSLLWPAACWHSSPGHQSELGQDSIIVNSKKKKNPCAMWDNFDEQNQLLASPFWATHFRTAWLSMCSKTAKSLLATDKSGITNGLCLKQMTASHHPAYHQVSSDTQQFPKCHLKNGGCSQWVQGKKITQCVGGESVSHGTFYLYSMTQAPS